MYTGTRKTSAGKREEIGEDLCARNTTNEQREFTGKNKRGRNSKRKDCRRSKTKRERESWSTRCLHGAYTCEGCMYTCVYVCVDKGRRKEERKDGRKDKKSREARAKDIREEGEKYNLTNKVARGVGKEGR